MSKYIQILKVYKISVQKKKIIFSAYTISQMVVRCTRMHHYKRTRLFLFVISQWILRNTRTPTNHRLKFVLHTRAMLSRHEKQTVDNEHNSMSVAYTRFINKLFVPGHRSIHQLRGLLRSWLTKSLIIRTRRVAFVFVRTLADVSCICKRELRDCIIAKRVDKAASSERVSKAGKGQLVSV